MSDFRVAILSAIADPNVAFVLLVCGILGLYFELSAPGAVFPGVMGGILLLLGLSGLAPAQTDWVGIALLFLAFACLILEVKFTAHGMLGIAGVTAMVFGALLLNVRLSTALLVSVPFGLITIFLVSLAVRARGNKVVTGVATMVDEVGTAATMIEPDGQVLVRGEYWAAVSAIPIQPGRKVRVTAVHGLTLEVEPWV